MTEPTLVPGLTNLGCVGRGSAWGTRRAAKLCPAPGNDDVAHDKIDDRRGGDGDECADRPAEGGAYEDCDEDEQGWMSS